MNSQAKQPNLAIENNLPAYLRSYDALSQHFRAHFDGLNTTTKGDKFAHFVQRLIPQTEIGAEFDTPSLSERKSGDEGVDLVAQGRDNSTVLYIQAKLWVDRAEAIDSIISKFRAYLKTTPKSSTGQQYLLAPDEKPAKFLVVTLSRLKNIRKRYEEREFASREFYRQCIADNALYFVDGEQILPILQAAYRKIGELPANLVLNLETQIISKDNVYMGIISSKELQALYRQFGDALFFENVRDFLGPGQDQKKGSRPTPNDAIIQTIAGNPEKLLGRNNGIVFRATEVQIGDALTQLKLSRGSIVNGCQTTMCLVEYAQQECYVPVKIVQTPDSWDIAEAANFQNSVADIDLKLARNLRPQLAKRAAALLGVQVQDGEKSAFQILDEIYEQKVAYDEARLLFIGLFSRTPNNVYDTHYGDLRHDLIDKFYKDDPYGETTFEVLFALQDASREGLKQAEATFTNSAYADMFKRFYRESSPSYRSFVTILALCGALNTDIAEREKDPLSEYDRVTKFFQQARNLLENQKQKFLRYWILAVKVLMQEVIRPDADDSEIQRDMSAISKRASFKGMFRKLCMDADVDERLRNSE